MKKIIELTDIKRNFQVGEETVHALRGISFTINEGEFVTIMGTSGSGKSTLLNTLGCLDTPSSGEYLLDGIPVRTMSKNERAILRNQRSGLFFKVTTCWLKLLRLKTWSCRLCTTQPSTPPSERTGPLKH